jgi:hypothetical protein
LEPVRGPVGRAGAEDDDGDVEVFHCLDESHTCDPTIIRRVIYRRSRLDTYQIEDKNILR